MKGENGQEEFWGFTILVIDWEKFIDEVELEKLEEASYHYQVWKKNPVTGKKLTIAQCEEPVMDNALKSYVRFRMIPGILKYARKKDGIPNHSFG